MFKQKLNDATLNLYVKSSGYVKHTALASISFMFATALLAGLSTFAAAELTLLTGATKIINQLQSTIQQVSTAAAIVGIGTGALLKKLSLGKGDRIETGNKIMMNSIWGWIILNGAILIFKWLNTSLSLDLTGDEFQ